MVPVSEELVRQLARPGYQDAVLVSPDDLSDQERQALPSWWADAVERDAGETMETAVAQWNTALPGKLPRFFELMQERAAGLHLARLGAKDEKVVLIYALHNPSADGEGDHPFVCWYGQPPREQLENARIDIERLPQSVRTVYTSLHDDFRVALSVPPDLSSATRCSRSISALATWSTTPTVTTSPIPLIW
jgi:hypothetical protein